MEGATEKEIAELSRGTWFRKAVVKQFPTLRIKLRAQYDFMDSNNPDWKRDEQIPPNAVSLAKNLSFVNTQRLPENETVKFNVDILLGGNKNLTLRDIAWKWKKDCRMWRWKNGPKLKENRSVSENMQGTGNLVD